MMDGSFLCFVPFKTGIELFFGTNADAELEELKAEKPYLKEVVKSFTAPSHHAERHVALVRLP